MRLQQVHETVPDPVWQLLAVYDGKD